MYVEVASTGSTRPRRAAVETAKRMIKNSSRLIDLENNGEWRVDKRTRGHDIVTNDRPVQTWVLILSNSKGERRFIPETRVWEWFKPHETPEPTV